MKTRLASALALSLALAGLAGSVALAAPPEPYWHDSGSRPPEGDAMKARMTGLTALTALVAGAAISAAAPPTPYGRPSVTSRVSVASNGAQPIYPPVSRCAHNDSAIDSAGRYVVFSSDAPNLVPGDTNGICDVFVHDRVARTTRRVSVASDGSQALAAPYFSGSELAWISANGRYVVFASNVGNLVAGDTNDATDVFRHDLRTRETVRVSVGSKGAQGNAASTTAAISADGRYVAFASEASNLVPGDTNGWQDVFLRDMTTHRTVRVSVSSVGEQASVGSSAPAVSGSGRYVSFTSSASNLVSGDTSQELCKCVPLNVYRHDMKTHKTERDSVASDGSQASYAGIPNCGFGAPPVATLPDPVGPLLPELAFNRCYSRGAGPGGISADGRFIVFISTATNLVPNDANEDGTGTSADVFVRDLITGRTERVSVDSNGHERQGRIYLPGVISGDGQVVSYRIEDATASVEGLQSQLTGVIGGFAQHAPIWLYDRASGSMELASGSRSAGGGCTGPSLPTGASSVNTTTALSHTGRYLLFESSESNLVKGDTNDRCDYFVRDRGPRAGIGGLGSAPGAEPAPECLTAEICVPPIPAQAELRGAQIRHRPELGDLYVRIDLNRLPAVSGDLPATGVLYGLGFTAGGLRYEVRAQRTPGPDYDAAGGASFALFRETAAGIYTKVATLKGGYGTVGDAVVTVVPVSAVGGSADLQDVTAFTAVGNYLSGATKVLDTLKVTR